MTNAGSRNAGVGPSFLFFADNSAGAKSFLGRVSAAWENPTAGAEAGSISFQVRANSGDTTAFTERMRITASGNVGIGTTSPAGLLHVKGTSPVRILGDPLTLSGSEYVDFMARSSVFASDLGGMRIQRQSSTGDIDTLFFAAASGSSMSEVMRVKGNGNVGIGTNPFSGKLHVVAGGSGVGVYGAVGAGSGIARFTNTGVWGDTPNGDAVLGTSNTRSGVVGISASGTGVVGGSTSGRAVTGDSGSNDGIVGSAHVGGKSGVVGLGGDGANGLAGITDSGVGVYGKSTTGGGVVGTTDSTGFNVAGVLGEATASSGTVVGVYGKALNDPNGTGVAGFGSTAGGYFKGTGSNGTGVVGTAGTTGGYFENTGSAGQAIALVGNAIQDRGSGGLVKAMAYIEPQAPSPFIRCYNSQATGGAVNTSPCGFTIGFFGTGGYIIDFGFKVDDRFVLTTSVQSSICTGARLGLGSNRQVDVVTSRCIDSIATFAPFFIFVY